MDRFALNTMLERLLDSEGHDPEARDALAAFATQLKCSSRWRFYSFLSTPGNKISGQTDLGTIEVENDRPVERRMSLGAHEERIGHYKLLRQGSELEITHFWKSESGSVSETELAQAWRLCMDKADRPIWFGEKAVKHLFTLPLGGRFARLIVNRELFLKLWSTEGPEIRPGGWAIQVEVSGG
jgi:hypothetical protein